MERGSGEEREKYEAWDQNDPKEVKKQLEALVELINTPSGWSEKSKAHLEAARQELQTHLESLEKKNE